MPHVVIRNHPQVPGAHQLVVDDIDMSEKVYAGAKLMIPTTLGMPPVLTVEIPCDVLDIDLPDVMIEAIRETKSDNEVAE